jgi:hypothetical protein
MNLFGKSLRDYVSFARTGMILIVLMGVLRFVVGASGVPYERATHLVSLTILALLLALIYGQRAASRGFGGYRHLLPTVFMLSASMYGFIIVAILVEVWGGIDGYFHAPGMGLAAPGMNVASHILGQLLAMIVTTLILWGVASLGFLLSRYLGFLASAFLLLAAMAVLRVAVGAAGVPYQVGTWITSITLLGLGLSFYFGYRAPTRGFTRYPQMVVVGALIAAGITLLVIYGIAVTDSLGIPNYFHAPGEGFQPPDFTAGEHIIGHLYFSIVAVIFMSILAGIGFAVGRSRASASPAT